MNSTDGDVLVCSIDHREISDRTETKEGEIKCEVCVHVRDSRVRHV